MQTSYCCRRGGGDVCVCVCVCVCWLVGWLVGWAALSISCHVLSNVDPGETSLCNPSQPTVPTNRPQEVGRGEWDDINDWARRSGYTGNPKRSFQAILVRQARFEVLDWSSISFKDEGESTRPAPWVAPLWGASLPGPSACALVASSLRGEIVPLHTRHLHAHPRPLARPACPTLTPVPLDACDSDDEGGSAEDVCRANPWEVMRNTPYGVAGTALRCKNTGRLVVAASLVRTSLVPAKGTASPAGSPWRASVRGPLRCDVRPLLRLQPTPCRAPPSSTPNIAAPAL